MGILKRYRNSFVGMSLLSAFIVAFVLISWPLEATYVPISGPYADAVHASEHNDGGDDEIDRGTEGVAEATLAVNTSTPDVSNAGSEIHRLFVTANTELTTGSFVTDTYYQITTVGDTDFTLIGAASNTVGVQFQATGAGGGTTGKAIVVIKNFNDGDNVNPFSEFNGTGNTTGKDWFVLRVEDANAVFDFSSNAFLKANAGRDWQGSATHPLDLVFRLDKTDDTTGSWICESLNAGFDNPITLAIDKAQFDYTIANPQAIIYDDDDNFTQQTIGTDITSSIVYITGVNDGAYDDVDGGSIYLQPGSAGFDGTQLTFKTIALVDVNDPITIDVETESTCGDCPFNGIFKIYNTGAILTLRWDQTNTTWQFENFYHPLTNWGAADNGTAAGITGYSDAYASLSKHDISFSVNNFRVDALVYIYDASSNTTGLTFEMPYANNSTMYGGMPIMTEDNSGGWFVDNLHGRVQLDPGDATVKAYPSGDIGTVTGWTASGTKGVWGSFFYFVD